MEYFSYIHTDPRSDLFRDELILYMFRGEIWHYFPFIDRNWTKAHLIKADLNNIVNMMLRGVNSTEFEF